MCGVDVMSCMLVITLPMIHVLALVCLSVERDTQKSLEDCNFLKGYGLDTRNGWIDFGCSVIQIQNIFHFVQYCELGFYQYWHMLFHFWLWSNFVDLAACDHLWLVTVASSVLWAHEDCLVLQSWWSDRTLPYHLCNSIGCKDGSVNTDSHVIKRFHCLVLTYPNVLHLTSMYRVCADA